MKNFKKLIFTVCMFLLSCVLVGTSTFAWFSMNDTVHVYGVDITAVGSGGIYFQIVAGNDPFNDETKQMLATAKTRTKTVYPTKVGSAISDDYVSPLTGYETTSDISQIKWAAAISVDKSLSTRWGNYYSITTAANEQDVYDTNGIYVKSVRNLFTLINRFRVRTNPSVGYDLAKDLFVEEVTIKESDGNDLSKSMLTAVRFLIVCKTGCALFDYTGTVIAGQPEYLGQKKALICAGDIVGDTVGEEVLTYMYFDGDDTNVYTDRVTANGYEVTFKLTITMPELN